MGEFSMCTLYFYLWVDIAILAIGSQLKALTNFIEDLLLIYYHKLIKYVGEGNLLVSC